MRFPFSFFTPPRQRKPRVCSVAILLSTLAGCGLLFAGDDAPTADTAITYTEVTGLVLGWDGKPAKGVEIWLYGLERAFMSDSKIAVSDAHGVFRVKFGNYDVDTANEKKLPRTGYGRYCFVVHPTKEHAGGLSPVFLHGIKPEEAYLERGDRVVALDKRHQNFVIQLYQGISVDGRIVDTKGRPLANDGILIRHNLHMASHTGAGGEIFEQTATSDKNGEFTFERVYPCYYEILKQDSGHHWLHAKFGSSEWREPDGTSKSDNADDFDWPGGEFDEDHDSILITAGAELLRYHGRVTDQDGRPIDKAGVDLGFNGPNGIRYRSTTTKEDGTFEFRVDQIAVGDIHAEYKGIQKEFTTDTGFLKPGVYNFKLTLPRNVDPKPTH